VNPTRQRPLSSGKQEIAPANGSGRVRHTKVETAATRLEPTDWTTLSFIGVNRRSSAANIVF